MASAASDQHIQGTEIVLPESLLLRAGQFTLEYENGEIRALQAGGRIALMRLYAAVRDSHWRTIPGVLTPIEKFVEENSFRIVFTMEHRQEEIDFAWHGTLTGSAEGIITFAFDGEARTTFARNRIGFCLLFPAGAGDLLCRAEHTDGSQSEASFPEWIDPNQPVLPFAEMRGISLNYGDGLCIGIEMEGDIFEMEDQRNWTDASFKVFCTPLRLPFPVPVPAGARIEQKITLRLESLSSRKIIAATENSEITLERGAAPEILLPDVGLGLSAEVPDSESVERLRRLRPSHLRVELRLQNREWRSELERGIEMARTLETPLEIALLCPAIGEIERVLSGLCAKVTAYQVPVCRWLIAPAKENLSEFQPFDKWLPAARPKLRQAAPLAPIFAGTRSDFLFLNRFPPPVCLCDGVTFAINPQVHAFDNRSLMENLAAQASAARSARRVAEDRPVVVSPVTLLPRFNPYAAEAVEAANPPADPRQKSLFGAAWTLGSLRALIQGRVSAATYYETTGAGGVLENGAVFPLYHILTDYNEFQGGYAGPLESSNDNAIVGLELRKEERHCLMIANLTPRAQTCRLRGKISERNLRALDESTLSAAVSAPETFRANSTSMPGSGEIVLCLAPYASICLN